MEEEDEKKRSKKEKREIDKRDGEREKESNAPKREPGAWASSKK